MREGEVKEKLKVEKKYKYCGWSFFIIAFFLLIMIPNREINLFDGLIYIPSRLCYFSALPLVISIFCFIKAKMSREAWRNIPEISGLLFANLFIGSILIGNLAWIHISMWGIVLSLIVGIMFFRKKLFWGNKALVLYFIVLLLVISISTLSAHYQGTGNFKYLFQLNVTLFLPWALIQYIHTRKRFLWSLFILSLSCIVFIGSVWKEFFVRLIENYANHAHVPISYLLGWNLITLETATFSTMAFIVFFMLAWTSQERKAQVGWWICVIFSMGAMVFSSERITFINGIIGVVIIVAIYFNKKKVMKFFGVVIICVLLVFAMHGKVHTVTKYTSRLTTITATGNSSNDGRLVMWTASLESMKAHPIYGIGYWNVYDMIRTYIIEHPNNKMIMRNRVTFQAEIVGRPWVHVHNTYLEMFVTSGVFGLFYFILFLIIVPTYIFRLLKRDGKNRLLVAIALLFVSYYVAGLTDELFMVWPLLKDSYLLLIFGLLYIDIIGERGKNAEKI